MSVPFHPPHQLAYTPQPPISQRASTSTTNTDGFPEASTSPVLSLPPPHSPSTSTTSSPRLHQSTTSGKTQSNTLLASPCPQTLPTLTLTCTLTSHPLWFHLHLSLKCGLVLFFGPASPAFSRGQDRQYHTLSTVSLEEEPSRPLAPTTAPLQTVPRILKNCLFHTSRLTVAKTVFCFLLPQSPHTFHKSLC